MNKRGEVSDNVLLNYFAYLLFGILFFVGILFFILRFYDGATLWEDFYAKEITRVIDRAEPGQEVYFDMTKGISLALKNKVDRSEIVTFDNAQNKVIVKLSSDGGTEFHYFNDVDVTDWRVELPSGSSTGNRVYFKIKGAAR